VSLATRTVVSVVLDAPLLGAVADDEFGPGAVAPPTLLAGDVLAEFELQPAAMSEATASSPAR
jgi:hypothetical protein